MSLFSGGFIIVDLEGVPVGEGEAEAKNGLESISKSLTAVLTAIYFLGFLVVTPHLSQYGVFPLAILKLQYLAAGVWLIAALGWPCLLIVMIGTSSLIPEGKDEGFLRNNFTLRGIWRHTRSTGLGMAIIVVPLVILLAVFKGFMFGSISDAGEFFGKVYFYDRNYEAWFGFFIFIVGPAVAAFYLARFAKKQKDDKKWKYSVLVFYLGGLSILILLWYVSYFARTWYPFIPYYLGGGKPISVVFLLRSEQGHKEFPVIPDSSGERSIPYKMLFETEKTFVVLSPKAEEQAIEFERDAVSGVVFLREAAAHAP